MGERIEGEPSLTARRVIAQLGCRPGVAELVDRNAYDERYGKRGERYQGTDGINLELVKESKEQLKDLHLCRHASARRDELVIPPRGVLQMSVWSLVTAAPTAASTAAAPTTTAAAAATSAAAAAARAATAAANLEVGVADDKAASHQTVNVVDLRAFHQGGTLGVNEDLHTRGIDHEVIYLRLALHSQHVLEASMRPGDDHHSQQSARLALLVQYLF